MSDLPTLGPELLRDPGFRPGRRVELPGPALLELPEKAVQFGTGALLRGLVDFFLDAANRQGRFGGRVVAVGSTGSGRDRALNEQGGLYTLAVQGVEAGRPMQELRVVASVSRALSAATQWDEVLACARSPGLELVFSNTTEIGIVLDPGDDPAAAPPRSFPGKLARFLYERARAFDYAEDRGVVVLPCELIEGNGDRLREVVLALAARWWPGDPFAAWVERAVPFCNTLVDRIVAGTPDDETLEGIWAGIGYRDRMLTTCEAYRLFAIEGDARLRERLGFAGADAGVVVAEDIAPYRERKVRLLNGAHTVLVPAALLCGLETVHDAVRHEQVGALLRRVLLDELLPALGVPGADDFARAVLDRFSNPFVHHALADITLQQTMKMRVRVVPSVLSYAARFGRAPASVAFGFAAYLLLLRGGAHGAARAAPPALLPDDQGERVRAHWAAMRGDEGPGELVRRVLADTALWGTDLGAVPGLADAVTKHLLLALRAGAPVALELHLATPVAP